jgi:hypothetical protein
VSPRTSSAASDKSKKSGASPLHQQQSVHTIPETGQLSSIPLTLAQSSKRTPEHAGIEDTHAAKHARAEVAASQGFIPPPKIDEE